MNCNDNSMTTDLALDDEIVISGIAGRLPGSDNVKHFQENLFNKMDLGSDDCRRWQHDHPDIPKRTGKVNNIHKFDAEYFDVPFNEAHLLDPMNRCLLEYTYEAIIDAGINPKDLRGTKTGVIVGTSFCESENIMVYEKTQFAGSLGCKRNMQANRISYWLGTTGPSFTIDSACSSSIFAIEQAYRYIRYGKCDSMIVAAINLCLNPQISLQFMRLGVLSPNGFCRPFDVSANGYMSSEAIAVVYLQKARNAKRIYATLVYSKTNCDGFKEQGITFPSAEMQSLLFQQFYDECNVSPFSVAYIEAHGTGTKVGDPEEINAIEKVFCKNRHSPLLIGSSKSNTGHSEPASGLLQIFKVVIAMETSMIPPNIHFTKERDDCEAFKKGTIRVVTTTTAWEPTFVGINSFGFGGANAHLLLAPNMKKKINGGAPEDDLPRLIVLSGRTEQAVESFLREVENQSVDVEYIRLLHDLFADDMQHHPYRGYTIVEPATLNNIISKVEHYSGRRKPICYVFSGIGSQWRGMGEALLRFPVFLKTVQKCDTVLRSYGVHIINILTSKQKTTFDSILNSVLGINMMQLGLIDLLMSVNIMPNYVIGHSIGELCCGYITGDLTIEQVILSAYYIGLALEASEIVHYIMADIGLGYTDTKDICPPDIKIICNYSSNSCCISGPTESMKAFTKKLEINEIFYKEVNCCNIPLHSCYLAPARNKILDYLYRVIPQKMSQSHIWRRLSCDTDLSCAEYFTNNLVNPMFFKDVTRLIPENVAFIEIAPDGILQRVLMELFDTTTIALAQRNCKDNVKVFLQGLGKMYNCGLQPQLANLYPTVEFPVSRGTPMISPSIKSALHTQDNKLFLNTLEIPVRVYKESNIIISGGVRIHGLMATPIFRRKPMESPVLEEYKFVAHRDKAKVSFEDGIILSTHLVLEYHQTSKVDIIEFIEDGDEIIIQELVSPIFVQVLTNLPLIQPNITLVKRTTFFDNITLPPKITVSQSKKLSIKNNAVLVAGCNLLTRSKNEILKEILLILKADGFLLTRGQSLTKEEIANAERYNLKVVLEKQTENEYITLMKKRGRPISKTEVICVNNYEFSWLEQLRSVLSAENELARSTRIIIVGERNAECGLLGLVNCLRKEPGGELIRGVFIQDENAPKFSFQDPFYAEQLQIDLVINVLRPGKIWGSYRHLPLAPLKPKLVHHAFVNQMVLGDLNSLRWIEGTITSNCQHEDLVNIIYAPLNFRDVMLATGKIMEGILSRGRLEDCMIGFEYAGIDNTGRRVMGIYETKCMSNKILTDKYLSWQIPDEWSLEDAATVPCVYGTCYYALYLHAKLKKGERILVHSGTGGVGQAAIHIALHDGCEVFTTVSTLEKRRFIRENFPSIPEDHIGYSRDTSFEQMIYQQTNGRGVDIVLNSLAEDKLQASVRCLAKGGRFLEIGKFDMMTNNTLDISVFSKGITFYGIMLDKLFTAEDERKQTLYTALATGIESGAVKPITRKIFQKDELEAAFRYMAAGKHIGKIIIKIQEEENFKDVPILALPRYYCLANRSYIILGGLGGFGMELADWLVIRGAKNLVMISRTGIKNGYQRMKIKQWKSYGVKVLIISNVDASNVKDCERMLKAAEELAPTDAIFNLAVLLNDKICPNHTIETFQEPFKAKAWATEYLDQLSRKICPQLRHFVVFSSVSCGKGNAGQTNYGMANSIMERICERRSQEGLHGLAIQWGAIGDVGILADMQEDDKKMIIGSTLQQKIRSCIEKLEEFLLQEQPVVTSMIVAEKHIDGGSINIIDTIANIMGLKDLNTVSHQARFSELGMDSMMAVEIKQSLEREFGVFLTAQDIRNLNLAKLIEMFNQEAKTEKLRSDDISDANNLVGVKLLVRMIDKVCATPDVCMNLPTKGDITRNEIFLLPGIEGCGDIFSSLGSKIEAPATCLQYGTYNTGKSFSTIAEIADNVLKHMMNRIKSKRDFLIIAYSYGTLIAIELARRLEGMLLRGRLILIDGAPEQLKILADQFITNTTINEIQNNTLLNIMDFLNPAVSGKLLLELNKCVSWDDKLNIFINHLSTTNKGLSSDFTRALCVTIYNHIRAIHAYDVVQQPKIISPIILLKPTLQSLRLPDEDYGLHKITTGNVEVHYVEGTHVTMLDSDKVVAAINKQYTKVPVENSQLYTERKK
ncbi:fatty acid synthase-like [Odontomachus brunneus]|uniref:fatty acid synthase-like n=1 Tax=Odontomachus brunneus TaxID=486640 RepID=UPI0013F27652|nr:fatty acid synthase-like [Odontomachus brunneus]